MNGTPAVATFRDLGSIQLLLSLGDERGVELYCESMLGPLRAHDGRHGSALIESLRGLHRGERPLGRGRGGARACTGTRCATGSARSSS